MDIIETGIEPPMQDWFAERFPRFFNAGTFERSVVWEKSSGQTPQETFKTYTDNRRDEHYGYGA